ncbi:MAG: hypothetical protein ACPGRX_08050 [Bdellovibrionales bacterium]
MQTTKNHYVISDIIAQLPFGFWVYFLTRPYEKDIWVKALYKCFPYLGQKPERSEIYNRLDRAVKLRNRVAHLEPIIKREELLIQEYRNISELLYAMCPQTQEWFGRICNFEKI